MGEEAIGGDGECELIDSEVAPEPGQKLCLAYILILGETGVASIEAQILLATPVSPRMRM